MNWFYYNVFSRQKFEDRVGMADLYMQALTCEITGFDIVLSGTTLIDDGNQHYQPYMEMLSHHVSSDFFSVRKKSIHEAEDMMVYKYNENITVTVLIKVSW